MSEIAEVRVPDIGDFDSVDVVEVLVKAGDVVAVDASLITLESDKASMEVPSPVAGRIESISVKVGDQVGEGALIARVVVTAEAPAESEEPAEGVVDEPAAVAAPPVPPAEPPVTPIVAPREPPAQALAGDTGRQPPPHASPSVRKFARELGADLHRVTGSGPKGRILLEDVQAFVKRQLTAAPAATGTGAGIPPIPVVDFSRYGEIEIQPLGRIRRAAAQNLHRSWLNVPRVTQFDEADITELEEFRQSLKDEAKERGVRLTLLAFLIRATVAALREFPDFNSSLDGSGENLVVKKYYHLGIAVDTPNGLVVPVVRDADKKGIWDLAAELGETSERARAGKLAPRDISGACFTISSLGGIGGTGFTPIINAPEVAILGVARSSLRPVYQGGELVPRLILPFSVAYDHRVIDGAVAVRFTTFLGRLLGDVRRLAL